MSKPMSAEERVALFLKRWSGCRIAGLNEEMFAGHLAFVIREERDASARQAQAEERERCAKVADEPWARLVWWGPGYGDGVQIMHFSGPPEALESEYLRGQLAEALEDATDLFGVEKPPTDAQPGWPMEAICHVLLEDDLYDDSHGPRRLVSKGGYYLWRDPSPPAWKLSSLTPTTEAPDAE